MTALNLSYWAYMIQVTLLTLCSDTLRELRNSWEDPFTPNTDNYAVSIPS